MKQKKNHIKMYSNLLLLLTAAIWGFAFVAQSVSMNYIGPCTFTFSRFFIGGVVLVPVIAFMNKKRNKEADLKTVEEKKENQKLLVCGGIFCGIALVAGSLAQQYGIQHTSVGKAGFITTLYIIIVPILGLFSKKRVKIKVWFSAVIALIGLYLICMTEKFAMSKGDSLVLLCALLFSFQIILVDYYSPKADPVKISCIQFFTAAIISFAGAVIFENPSVSGMMKAAIPILYAGVLSSGVAYTLQVVVQRNTDPTVASLIMSLESVIATIAGFLLLHQKLTIRELTGCVIVFVAVILVQLPDKPKK